MGNQSMSVNIALIKENVFSCMFHFINLLLTIHKIKNRTCRFGTSLLTSTKRSELQP